MDKKTTAQRICESTEEIKKASEEIKAKLKGSR